MRTTVRVTGPSKQRTAGRGYRPGSRIMAWPDGDSGRTTDDGRGAPYSSDYRLSSRQSFVAARLPARSGYILPFTGGLEDVIREPFRRPNWPARLRRNRQSGRSDVNQAIPFSAWRNRGSAASVVGRRARGVETGNWVLVRGDS